MTVQPHPDFMKAGEIAARAISDAMKEVKPGAKVLNVCVLAEKRILECGATGLAFPCNVSINEEAAHYTSPHADKKVFPDKGLVKIDIGAHVNGYLSDTAVTIDLDGSYEKYVVSAKEALEAAIHTVRPGVSVGEVGAAIERTIKKYGLKPVHQLTGHQLKQWSLHAGKNVPNVSMSIAPKMNLGEMFAVEPFSTNGNGTVTGAKESYIFSNDMGSKKKLDRLTLQIRNIARQKFGTLPWTSRWLHRIKTDIDIDAAVRNLQRAGAIHGYPVLIEGKKGMVSQFEHSMFVGENGAIVSTRRPDE
ncbi:MAG: type II methionyl aminopeptidase [Candidatus Thorarchaeota archaeon]|nr:type II methionyl aminopeptidase [Candidatus Thorarchaeota archaeon]